MQPQRWQVWAGILLLLAVTVPDLSEAAVLSRPDRRAIPLLVAQTGRLRKYGTGVVVAPNTILTAQHNLAADMQVVLPTAPVSAQPACRTRYEGVAVVKASLPQGTPFYRVSFRTPVVGETVTVAGYPLRRWRVATAQITNIIQSANLSGRIVATPLLVFRPALDYGASGAPVLDRRGQVIGITVASNRQANYSIAFPTATGLRACRRFVR